MAASSGRFRGPRRRRIGALAAVAALLGLMTLGSGSASATITERHRFTQPYDFVNWDCGYPMQVAGVESHQIQIRADKKVDGIVFVTDNYAFKETWTTADGRWFTLQADAVSKDVRAKSLGGTLYEFTFHQSGRTCTITSTRRGSRRLHENAGTWRSTTHRPRRRLVQLPGGPRSRGRIPCSTWTCAGSSHRSSARTRLAT